MKKLILNLTLLLTINCELFAQVPVASFSCSDTVFCEKQCVDFFDQSTNNPTSWHWFFWGGSPDTSSYQNPVGICYNSYGIFDVTLVACNSFGCDTITYFQFIQEYQNPSDTIWEYNGQLYSQWFSSYQWYEVNSGIIPGATNWNLIPPGPGIYYCNVTNSIGCVATSNPIVSTGIKDSPATKDRVDIAPNPFSNEIEISFKNQNVKQTSVCIKDILGKEVFSKNYYQISKSLDLELGSLQNGIYFLEIITDEKKIVSKIVKQ